MLLHWCTLEPAGPYNLAAIRFSTPIRVRSLRVFPTDARPFSHNSEIVAHTEPEAFLLDIFFNAHPIQTASSDAKQKQKAANALVPSVIAYAGGQMDFEVDMGADCATRLMIIKGAFESISLAVYGDVVSELPPLLSSYAPMHLLPLPNSTPLTRSLDPSNSLDPTALAKELLTLIPEPFEPPLALVVRLMLCLKPSNDDWDQEAFPYIFADLSENNEDFDLDTAWKVTGRGVADDIPSEVLDEFAERVSAVIGTHSIDQSYLTAGILSHVASQQPYFARVLMQRLDLDQIFGSSTLDDLTLLRLLDASANASIAAHLRTLPAFMEALTSIQVPSALPHDKQTKKVARKLEIRLKQWENLEDALSNTQADFHAAAALMRNIAGIDGSELAFGIWLKVITTHVDLVTKLCENPVLPKSRDRDRLGATTRMLLAADGKGSTEGEVSHDEFIAFVRAYIGVASVLAVYAWSDSLPNDRCRERTLAVLRLWQGVDGYREIVNHQMLLRQMTFRLECMTTDNDPPTSSGIHAENILLVLANEPISMHSYDVVKCVLNLQQPLSVINEEERLALRRAALIADDGITAAIEELTAVGEISKTSMELNRIRTLRVALAVVERELEEDENGEWQVLQALWEERSHGLVPHLVDIFFAVNEDLRSHFMLSPPPSGQKAGHSVKLLFLISEELLRLIGRLVSDYPLTSRLTRVLVAALADVFVCTDAADMTYTQSSSTSIAAQRTRQRCIDLVCRLGEPLVHTESQRIGSEVVLRALLEHGLSCNHRDPVHHLQQVFCLIDQLMPQSSDAHQLHWTIHVFPNLLPELRAFIRALDTENKLHFIKRLVNLDQGTVGIGEWMLLEELKELFEVLLLSRDAMVDDQYYLVNQYQISLALRFLAELLSTTSTLATWSLTTISTVPEVAQLLGRCFLALLDEHTASPYQTQVALSIVVAEAASLDPDLKFAAALILLRGLQRPEVSFTAFKTIFRPALRLLKELPPQFVDADRLQQEMGATFSAISDSEPTLAKFDEDGAEAILSALEWLPERDLVNVTGVGTDPFVKLTSSMLAILSPGHTDDLEAVRSKFSVSDDIAAEAASPPPENIKLSITTLEDLLQPPIPIPSTPKRGSSSQDVLGLVTLSPPTALLRSPTTIGLTKTYFNNDFRQLRQQPSARQNTSRLPSMHVDVGIVT